MDLCLELQEKIVSFPRQSLEFKNGILKMSVNKIEVKYLTKNTTSFAYIINQISVYQIRSIWNVTPQDFT